MASLSKDGNGWRILFVDPSTRKRPTIRLGECSKKNAQTALNMVENLVEAKSLGQPIKQQTAAWLESIAGTPLRERLAKVGLVEASKTSTLEKFVNEFLEHHEQRGDVTEGTLTTWKHTRRNLIGYFGPDKDIRTIKPEHAALWSAWLRTDQKLAENTIRKRCQFARRFFRVAVKRKQISENPFMELAATTIPVPERQYFVEREVVDDLLDQCHGPEYRLLLVFARYLGVRVPSEIVPLKWSDVDWDGQRIIVTSPKTRRHGQASRVVPIFPEVMPALQEAWDAAPEGAVRIFPSIKSGEKNMGTWLKRAILKTGRQPWPRLWQNFRATRATELADQYPSHVAAAWLGHSEVIANGFYRQVTLDHFDRASQEPTGPMPGESTTRGTGTESGTVTARLSPIRGSSRKNKSPEKHGAGEGCSLMSTPQVRMQGLEPWTYGLKVRCSTD